MSVEGADSDANGNWWQVRPMWQKVGIIALGIAIIGGLLGGGDEDETDFAAATTTTVADTGTTTVVTTTTVGATDTTGAVTTTAPETDWLAMLEECYNDEGLEEFHGERACQSFPGVTEIREVGGFLVITAHRDVALQACRDVYGFLEWKGSVDVEDPAVGRVVRAREVGDTGIGPCEET